MKRLALLTLATALAAGAASAGDNDWRLRIRKEVDGWSASFSGPMDYGSGRSRVRGSGVKVEKSRALAAFTKLRIDGPIDVRLNQAGSDQATVVADDNIEPLIETVVEGDALIVRMRRDAGFTTRSAPLVRLDARALQAIAVNGSGDLGVEHFKGDSLGLNVIGSGDVHLGAVELRELNVSISGSGDVRLAGRAEQQSWSVSGSGDVDARSLSGRAAKVSINGSGDVELGVTEQLDVQLSGSGDLNYAGRPQLRQSVSGSGEIHRR
ncbi:head GIN domain-containing protein [Roseateles saccharophilus]|uniref:Putative autotransporter adhesin-like protein n=1 Tax=Roseateles saccharophilus TaxID=304 RepID=A0A4R3V2P6_ROSSA|nr:head GIN domain-containing protein [Roseateles saccharophilus]TCU97457.1 putative autotransporter adhesin-like protein [Roseateles saccharophilus]